MNYHHHCIIISKKIIINVQLRLIVTVNCFTLIDQLNLEFCDNQLKIVKLNTKDLLFSVSHCDDLMLFFVKHATELNISGFRTVYQTKQD